MNVLLIGSGGREHALAWKLAQSPRLNRLYVAPGNPGACQHGEAVAIDPMDFGALADFSLENGIDLVIVGPEQPLVAGIADYLESRGIAVLGPNKSAARLEGSKEFSKAFMQRHGIPTAPYSSFEAHQLAEALAFAAKQPLPLVVKADGLAAGKGVIICQTHAEAAAAIESMLASGAFGEAGRRVVVESFLTGIEISVFVLTDGKDFALLPSAKDYKRIGEGDTGPNTGGMGAVSPVPFANEAFLEKVAARIITPTLKGLQQEGIVYKGFLFIGLMVQNGEPFVLEYNCRMGDPETQAVLPRLEGDLLSLCEGVVHGDLAARPFRISPETCAGLVMVSGGYPDAYEKGKPIVGLDTVTEGMVFHAGARIDQGRLVTDGGRVLFFAGKGDDIASAMAQALRMAEKVRFENCYYRRDIGQDLLS